MIVKHRLSSHRILLCLLLANLGLYLLAAPVLAQQSPVIPNFWDPQERFVKPNVKDLPRLRFLTTTDFPPFSYIDTDKRLIGFHVDLARAICSELEVLAVCQIQAFPFAELASRLTDKAGEAIMAGQSVSLENREKFDFTRPYFWLPARFVAKKSSGLSEPLIESLAGKEVAIVDGTRHAAMAMAKFGDLHLRIYDSQQSALNALKKDEVAAVFSDALSLSFWLQNKTEGQDCCQYVGGPYLSDTYLGNGLTIAVAKDNRQLQDAINFALRSLNDRGTFAELYLRYFPIGLY